MLRKSFTRLDNMDGKAAFRQTRIARWTFLVRSGNDGSGPAAAPVALRRPVLACWLDLRVEGRRPAGPGCQPIRLRAVRWAE